MTGALRIQQDVGLLTNIRMAVEVAVAIAHLSGRRLSMPFEVPIPPAPVSSIPAEKRGTPGGFSIYSSFPFQLFILMSGQVNSMVELSRPTSGEWWRKACASSTRR